MPRGGTQGAARGLAKRTNLIQRAIDYASHQRGDPYVWGGTGPGGFDCSGLVYAAYRNAGYMGIGRTTYDQIKQGQAVQSAAQLRPGDIVFPSPHHEGLYVGHGMILEAPHTGDHIKYIPLSQFGFWQARRLFAGGGGVIPPRAIGGISRNGLPVPHPSVNPQLFQQWMQQMGREQSQAMKQFSQQQGQLSQQFRQTMLTQAAQTRQANLGAQLQQQAADRQNAALTAQRTLNGGLSASGYSGSATDLAAQNKQKTDTLRSQALKRAGLVG